ncbi:MAG: class I SAM-dependent methyltransferase, partial [Deltaproteobacteria bacterium]|nr:class I SAM-dependent methyltransferase [Deltaproteobacteria bacterium]
RTPEARALSRPPLERYFYRLRYERVRRLLGLHAQNARKALDMGCGFGLHTGHLQRELHVPTVGIDLDRNKLLLAASRHRSDRGDFPAFAAADVTRPPFRPGCFDCILMTEVLEHLVKPREGLAAANTLLAPGGTLILTTPSRHDLAYTLNPFRVLEKLLSLVWDEVLPPYHHLHERREYDRKNPARQYGIHFHFSRQELAGMLSENGFDTVYLGSFEVEIPLLPWAARLAGRTPERMARCLDPVVSRLEQIPILNLLGQHLVCIALKDREIR